MKRLFRIFDLSKNEQLVVLIVMLILMTIAFVAYERRVHRLQLGTGAVPEATESPSPVKTDHEQ
jgi:hypothetical protein